MVFWNFVVFFFQGRIPTIKVTLCTIQFFPTKPLEFARPFGCLSDLEFNNICGEAGYQNLINEVLRQAKEQEEAIAPHHT